MKRQVPGLSETARDSRPEPDGVFLVQVDGAQFRWHAHKPFYVLRLSVLEPRTLAGQSIVGRLYSTQKAMWELGWFLRDFLYDPEILARDQVDEKALPGLRGVVKQSCGALSNLEVHHRELRSQSGDDVEQNLITLCTACHASVHRGTD